AAVLIRSLHDALPILGAASSGLLLYGLALIFGLTGETQLQAAGAALAAVRPNQGAIFLALSLLIAGFAIRIGLLPIQWWVRGFRSEEHTSELQSPYDL